jgi:hypothetical protein
MPSRSLLLRTLAITPIVATLAMWSSHVADARPTFEVERVAEADALPSVELADATATQLDRPLRKVPLPKARITREIALAARDFLDHPMGSETLRDVDGCTYTFAVERHYHAPESGILPSGWHKGVTVYAME